MKNLLMIAYFFPPLGGPGVQRVQKFVKYLPAFGWQPQILTVKNIEYIAYDNSLLSEIGNARVYRSESLDPMRLLYFFEKIRLKKRERIYRKIPENKKKFWRDVFPIDSKIGWLPFALQKGKYILKIQKTDVIYATVGPYSNALIGYLLAKRFRLPLIIDYRDLWKGKPDITYFSRWHRKVAEKWEKKILEFAEKIIVNTQFSKEKIQKLFPEIETKKFTVIYNGWDKNDFSENFSKKNGKKIIFTYTGGFYGERTPKYFVAAINELIEENKLPNNVEFRFIGNYFSEIQEILKGIKKREIVKIIPQLSHKESIEKLLESDVLMLFIAKEKSEIIVPAKVFEYLAARRPILAMIPRRGETAKIISENGAGLLSEIDDIALIKKNILKFVDLKTNGKLETHFHLSERNYDKYERKYLTEKLAKILDKASGKN